MSRVDIIASPIRLIDYAVLDLHVAAVNLEGERTEVQNNMQLDVSDVKSAGVLEESGLKVFTVCLTTSITPYAEEASYECVASVMGTFMVDGSRDRSDEEVIDYLETKGVEELYGVSRMVIADATASGLFGAMMIPSIEVISD